MDGESLERSVDLELEEELGGGPEDDGADETGEDGSPGLEDVGTRGDGHETGEAAVAHGDEVPDLVEGVVEDHGTDATGGGGEGGGDRAAGNVDGRLTGDGEDGAGVETVPADPEDEGAEHDEGGVVAGHGHGAAGGVEAAGTGTDDGGTHETRDTTGHVDDTGAGEIVHADVIEHIGVAILVGLPVAEPAGGVPDPVDDDGVDEAGEDDGVGDVGLERGALGHGTGGDGGGGGGEGPLEEEDVPVGEGLVVVTLGEEEVALAGELAGEGVGVLGAVRDGVAEAEVGHAADASVENVLDEDVHDVLGADGARAEHGEASLHEEDEEAGDEHVGDVLGAGDQADLHVNRFVGVGGGEERTAVGGVTLTEDVDCEERSAKVSSGFCFGFLVGIGGLLGSPKGRECAGSPGRSRAWRRRFRVTTLD